MKLGHIALCINDISEITDFYFNILEMKEVRSFVIKEDFAQKLFGMDQETSVFLLKKDELQLELFISQEKNKAGFNHLCFSVKNREEIFKKANSCGYECIRIERETFDLIFIKDKSGNSFELKELS